MKIFVPLAIGLCAAAAHANVILQDGTFANTNWSAIENFGQGSATSAQLASGGNPGTARRITNTVNNASPITMTAFHAYGNTTATRYAPQTQGAITSLNVSIDARYVSGPSDGQGFAFAFKQGQVIYTSAPIFITSTTAWQHIALTLNAASFTRIDGLAGGPDFSASAAPIRFGIATSNSLDFGVTGFSSVADYDNFFVEVVNVPAPSTALVLCGAAVFVGRRRRS